MMLFSSVLQQMTELHYVMIRLLSFRYCVLSHPFLIQHLIGDVNDNVPLLSLWTSFDDRLTPDLKDAYLSKKNRKQTRDTSKVCYTVSFNTAGRLPGLATDQALLLPSWNVSFGWHFVACIVPATPCMVMQFLKKKRSVSDLSMGGPSEPYSAASTTFEQTLCKIRAEANHTSCNSLVELEVHVLPNFKLKT